MESLSLAQAGAVLREASVFHFVFLLAALDAFVNGPKLRSPGRSVLLFTISITSVVASLVHSMGWVAFVCSELLWIAAFVESAYWDRKTKAEELALAKAKALEGTVGKNKTPLLPSQVLDYLKKAVVDFKLNVSGQNNCKSKQWKLLLDQDGIQVYQSDFPGQSCKFWKVETELEGNMETFKREIFDYDVRCAWDSAISSGKILKQYPAIESIGEVYLMQIFTAPQAGGSVSSRELVDFGVLQNQATPEAPYIFVNVSVPKDMFSLFPELPQKATGVRAFGHPGSGSLIEPILDKPGKFRYVLVNALDLGGWLPASAINSATSAALMESTKAMIANLKRVQPAVALTK